MSSNILSDSGGARSKGPLFKSILARLSGGDRVHVASLFAERMIEQGAAIGFPVFDTGMGGDVVFSSETWKAVDALIKIIEAVEKKSIKALDTETKEHYVKTVDREVQEDCSGANIEELLSRLRPIVYLASTTADLNPERERVSDELSAHGCRVVSESWSSANRVEYGSRVEKAMERAALSIHLVSSQVDSAVEIQYEIAKRNNIRQVVWASKDARSVSTGFLQSLRSESRPDLEYLEKQTIGQMQDIIFDLLGPLPSSGQAVSPKLPETKTDGRAKIYLVCAREDHPLLVKENNASHLKAFIEAQRLEVLLSDPSAAIPSEVRADHRDKLKRCDGVLLYWGNASEAWVHEKLRELNQAIGWRSSRAFVVKAVYVTGPPSDSKREFITPGATVIQHFGRFSAAMWEPLFAPLRKN
jgi:hypothetical protein